jgi:sugar lactone lactonase YvrE
MAPRSVSRELAPPESDDLPASKPTPVTASTTAASRFWQPPGERTFFAILLVCAAVVRMAGLGILEPNVSTIEVSHLAAVEAILVDRDPGAFARTSAGASGLALFPAALLQVIRPEPELALRLYAALGSLAFIALFYKLCRSRFPPIVSLTATALLAFSPWSIYFGRNGELNVFVGLWAVVAALALKSAMQGGAPRRWLLAGGAATVGLYWHPSAIWLLPALAIPIVWAAVEDRTVRPRLTIALCVFLAAGLIVAAPRVPGLIEAPISTAGIAVAEGAQPDPPLPLRTRAQQAIRAFLLLDPTVPGDARYQETGRAPLDAMTGLLLVGGVILAAWSLPARVLPVAMFVIPLVGTQLVSARVPTLADALVAMPGLFLLVAATLESLVAVLPFPTVTRAALLVAIPAYALFGWQAYTGWIGSATSAQARQPALDYDEIDAWAEEQRAHLFAGQPTITAQAWRAEHPHLATGSRVIRRPRNAASTTPAPLALTSINLSQVATANGETGPRAPRGVAVTAAGDVFVADATGRLSRLDADKNALVPLPQRVPPLEQVSDLAADPQGFLYLADAERSVLVKVSPAGEPVGTIGSDWGMYRPRGLAIGPDGRIYVADTGRNRIAVGTPDGRFEKGISPPASFGTFEQPTEVAVDQSGRIYVGLPEIGRLAILDDGGQVLGGWSIPKGNTIESPRLAVVADGAIAATDPAQGKIRVTDADGRELAVSDLPGRPYGLAVANGRLFVGEPSNGRLVIYSLGTP